MTNPVEIIDTATRPEATVEICLRGDLVAEFENLEAALIAAQAKPVGDSLAAGGDVVRAAQAIEDLRTQMRDSTVAFRLRAMPRKQYRELVDAHPPRRDEFDQVHPDDADMQVNTETFYTPLIRACLIAPELDADRLVRLLDETLSDRQFEQLAEAAFLVNRGVVSVPFSSRASRVLSTLNGE